MEKLKNIFMIWGQIIVLLGLFFGIFFGVLMCLIQQEFHLIPISGNFIINYYPIDLQIQDLINISLIICCTGLLTSFIVSRRKLFYKDLI